MTLTVICEYLVLQQDCATACYQALWLWNVLDIQLCTYWLQIPLWVRSKSLRQGFRKLLIGVVCLWETGYVFWGSGEIWALLWGIAIKFAEINNWISMTTAFWILEVFAWYFGSYYLKQVVEHCCSDVCNENVACVLKWDWCWAHCHWEPFLLSADFGLQVITQAVKT